MPDEAAARLDWVLGFLRAEFPEGLQGYQDEVAVDVGLALACKLAAGDRVAFEAIAQTARRHRQRRAAYELQPGLEALEPYPALRGGLGRAFPRQPHRCVELIVRAGLAAQLGKEALAPLAALSDDVAGKDAEGSRVLDEWHRLLTAAPDVAPLVRTFVRAQRLRGADPAPPPGVRRALSQPLKLAGELAYLEGQATAHPERADLAARLQTLRRRVADQEGETQASGREAAARLAQVAAEAQLAAAEHLLGQCFEAHLARIARIAVSDTGGRHDDAVNAAVLLATVSQNRRLLRRLLRAYFAGERDWYGRHPGNAAFLKSMAARGADAQAWLARQPRAYPLPDAQGGRVHLWMETDPLRVLQMGNLFGTCLSAGDTNAFATVANACEANKRVVFARDDAGRSVGRQLIAINEEGGLVGFRVYSTVDSDAGGRGLRSIFRRYAAAVAARCGLRLADDGPVPRLFAQAWYDDGVYSWTDDEGREETAARAR